MTHFTDTNFFHVFIIIILIQWLCPDLSHLASSGTELCCTSHANDRKSWTKCDTTVQVADTLETIRHASKLVPHVEVAQAKLGHLD